MNNMILSLDSVLQTVFGICSLRSSGVKRKRIQEVGVDLRSFLDSVEGSWLTTGERILLAAEREFAMEGAACRALDARVLFVALPRYLTPTYLAPDLLLRQVQLAMVDSILEYLVYTMRYTHDASVLRRALVDAKWELKRERRMQSITRKVNSERAKVSAAERDHLDRVCGAAIEQAIRESFTADDPHL